MTCMKLVMIWYRQYTLAHAWHMVASALMMMSMAEGGIGHQCSADDTHVLPAAMFNGDIVLQMDIWQNSDCSVPL